MTKGSTWETKKGKSFSKLTQNINTDVVIVGAGLAGIFNAYTLSKAGLNVVVLGKDEEILKHATEDTTAFITQIIDTSYDEMVDIFGAEIAKLVWQSGKDAIDSIATIVKKEKIECEFKYSSVYTYAKNDKEFEEISEEYNAVKKAGFKASIEKDGSKLNFPNAGFAEVPSQAKFHPLKFGFALAKAAQNLGVKIFTNSEVLAVDGAVVKTKEGQVQAKDVLIATYFPFTNEGTRFRKAMYMSYVYEIEIAKKLIPEGMYLDMNNPYHYFRIDSGSKFDRMIVGGEDHRKDIPINPQKNYDALEIYVRTVLGDNPYKIIRFWRGPILESTDGLPLIGKIKPNLYVVTAFSGNGMTYSSLSSTIIRDLILEKSNPYVNLYRLNRIPSLKQLTTKFSDYMGEFFGGALKNFLS